MKKSSTKRANDDVTTVGGRRMAKAGGNESPRRTKRSPGTRPAEAVSVSAGVVSGVDGIVGLDLGDRESHFCVLSVAKGEVVERGVVRTTAVKLQERFGKKPPMRIVIEAGGHSPWVSRTLEAMGHEVLVANPNRLVLGGRRRRKTDRIDAEQLARIGRVDPSLLHAIRHRSPMAQADLAVLRSRDVVVRTRAQLVNHTRGVVKAAGGRLSSSSTAAFAAKVSGQIPEELRPALMPVLAMIAELTAKIRDYDREIERMAKEKYPETSLLMAISGVGALTALAFVLTFEDPARFRKSRTAPAYVGLVPCVHQSGDSNPELRISKTGSGFLRRLLIQSAHYILGPFGSDSDLRRFGERLAGRGGKNAKKRASVAVARKLTVLMHRLWSRGEAYDPLYQAHRDESRAGAQVQA